MGVLQTPAKILRKGYYIEACATSVKVETIVYLVESRVPFFNYLINRGATTAAWDYLLGEPIVLLTTIHDHVIYLHNTIRLSSDTFL